MSISCKNKGPMVVSINGLTLGIFSLINSSTLVGNFLASSYNPIKGKKLSILLLISFFSLLKFLFRTIFKRSTISSN